VAGQFAQGALGLCQVRALAFAQLARVFDRLLEAGNVGTDLVIACLHARQGLAARRVHAALALDGGLRGPLGGELGLHGQLARAHRRIVYLRAAVEFAQPQRQQFRVQPPLLLLERLVAPRGRGLALQAACFSTSSRTSCSRSVLAGVGDARFVSCGAPCSGRYRPLFHEGAHVLGLRVDDARSCPLDDRAAARADRC
jgi:hypothetical protein